ncbi:MAG: hypothetical protein COW11_05050 [Candidatus Omnitrophica bacterium CG12_big_fil_rev_8_21_14_0_65_43_15]|uniref:Uncharacterized protein n=1 Tax=Candidatus Taenaricola geysiri TaxID=1974752 RepID=A0A2J0LGX1_9BACT|nr:MAG: hypothetical protein AUJ89_03730 [Candidatus Omnitrophica bacterium CG1_02_43_210]PIR65281.1 MAG: hypothetical protein COU52_05145 [Candidatus Omnitrophica bacterium CG10_big_fil_rev_8_21_14_0_10_43_8]PIV12173.1 MAG: hypothetical protein COS48_02145 [Candidatus Omnitrophica bacterium CG03_land_8_20_14_0_80_43_22]PIW66104.1 MAG: hypothetical protein COW11_05050 [Candidatus Omnitrophica bacterium CG12_big_fil_rev_8_21_14_0_65_43_15]PIW80138.1 MAG: hypothetical protein COZ98_03895 [Candida
MKSKALRFCGVFFLFISAIHIARFMFPDLSIKFGFNEPLWYSILALVVPLIIGLWALRLSRKL